MRQKPSITFAMGALLSLLVAVTAARAQASDLIGILTSQLGVTQEQAAGGAGSIFNLAKQDLSPEDFSKLAGAVPEMDALLSAAPKTEGSLKGLGAAAAMLGSQAGAATGLASLAGSFGKLGMDGGMIQQFVPIILQYVQSLGGDSVMSLLQGVLM